MHILLTIVICLSIPLMVSPRSAPEEEDEEVKVGNFLLPVSQQPGPLFSIGQNIIDKGDKLGLVGGLNLFGPDQYSAVPISAFVYGMSDTSSVLLAVPYSFQKQGIDRSRGVGDIVAQFEYAFYQYAKPTFTYQATCLTRASAPTGSTKKNPPLGAGGPRFLFGATFSYTSIDWLWFVSSAGNIATKGHNRKIGSVFLYEGGFGKNIGTRPGWIFTWLIEFNGRYQSRTYQCSVTQCDSGSNVFYLTPSIWISSKRLIVQAGISLLPIQHLFGCQTRNEIGAIFTIGWKFNG
jgi:hypothetical protein